MSRYYIRLVIPYVIWISIRAISCLTTYYSFQWVIQVTFLKFVDQREILFDCAPFCFYSSILEVSGHFMTFSIKFGVLFHKAILLLLKFSIFICGDRYWHCKEALQLAAYFRHHIIIQPDWVIKLPPFEPWTVITVTDHHGFASHSSFQVFNVLKEYKGSWLKEGCQF